MATWTVITGNQVILNKSGHINWQDILSVALLSGVYCNELLLLHTLLA